MTLPCPACGAEIALTAWLDRLGLCWPYRRFVSTRCTACDAAATLMPGWDTIVIGLVPDDRDPALVPTARLELDEDYAASWSSNGVRVTLGERRWTAVAAEGDRAD